jgi:hypothetical protein
MATAKKATAAVDVASILAGAAKPADKKAASKVPVMQVGAEVQTLVKRKQEIVAQMDALSAEDEMVSADIIGQVTPLYEEKCKRDFTSSVKIPSIDGTNITMSWKSAYSKIAPQSEPEIQSIVGEQYDRWFTKQTTITVKDQSADFLTKLIELVGAENFATYFAVEQNIAPTANFTEEKYRMLNEQQRNSLAPIVKQYKPAIRAK